MKSQLAILLIISVFLLAASIALAHIKFNSKIESANVRAVKQDMSLIASLALSYYKTPAIIGGGGKVFSIMDFYNYSGYQLSSDGNKIQTENGQIEIAKSSENELKIIGYCAELDFDIDKSIYAKLSLNKFDDIDEAYEVLN
ncbi:MAG: hypothetical protein DRI23_09165 [Candidatus Cloacimonadota bacterium]|nr:MAG: hypothetical protein DRI23_09165 [Candidatus Cloacimonadota bacterium]RLC49930.1 MAG: hypothetical protein DRH79_08365 [Candidatus Cloacimonadota bacterium]